MHNLFATIVGLASVFAIALAACTETTTKRDTPAQGENVDPFAAVESKAPHNPLRNAYYGDLHLHTSYSFDGYLLFESRADPEHAYRFARGEAISLHGTQVKRSWSLDFAAVTDHSEFMGAMQELEDPESTISKSDLGTRIRKDDQDAKASVLKAWGLHRQLPGFNPEALVKSAWHKTMDAANGNYRPGSFTTFVGYEWTSQLGMENFIDEHDNWRGSGKGMANLHRNVIFKGRAAPLPFTSLDSVRPEDLWTYLEASRQRGMEAIAIPHNANASNGLMFDWVDSDGRTIDKEYAARRILNEPLVEMGQLKGQSETHPGISPNDEFATFELDDFTAQPGEKRNLHGSYIRDAYGRGLVIAQNIGVNPYKFGLEGGTDIHNGLSTSDENAFMGKDHGGIDPTQRSFTEDFAQTVATDPAKIPFRFTFKSGSGHLTGVWAESNTRPSIFAALRRKEAFATSGTRLKFRFFGGWAFPQSLLADQEWVKTAYSEGVPMGGDLPVAGESKQAPVFAIWAVKDPDGANLDRAQVIKIWLEGTKHHEKIFDVALSDGRKVNAKTGKARPVGNTVDIRTARYSNSIGAVELKTLWRDPEFDPREAAVYYLRVLEIPTPRWSTIMSAKAGVPPPKDVPATIQERGWSSPIWYTPPSR